MKASQVAAMRSRAARPAGDLMSKRHVALVAQEVEGDARQLRMRPGPHDPVRVTPVILDDDHVRAEVGEDLRRQRTHDDGGQVEHAPPGERPRGDRRSGGRFGHGRQVVRPAARGGGRVGRMSALRVAASRKGR